ncbi:MAG: hypothetical protein IJC48_00805 [Clostridia bacterium]|nr:hypothetical protein [Clostridia bacterium]
MICIQKEIERLERLYEGRRAFHGEMHDHSASGGTSDGKTPLDAWKKQMAELKMDFAAILDHRQVRHMYLPEWNDTVFIAGTEPGTGISDCNARDSHLHYNILLPDRDLLAEILNEFPEYEFTGGIEGHFKYPWFTRERFCELIDSVKAHGGMFVHPHPKQVMDSDDPLDYWFRDETGIEVFYISMDSEETKANYPLWRSLLSAGKRVWASAGGDLHTDAHDYALTTVYSEKQQCASFISHIRVGDYTCGGVGIRMAIGDTVMGGQCAFSGNTLIVSVKDFHDSVKLAGHDYRMDLFAGEEVVFSAPVNPDKTHYFAVPAKDAPFYRAEIFDETRNLRIAIGNPIWNER